MIGDQMLIWMSEQAAGSVRQLRDKMCWFANASSAPDARTRANRWIRDCVTTGRIGVDWNEGYWSAVPPTLTTIPGGNAIGLLTGGRTLDLDARLSKAENNGEVLVHRTQQSPAGLDLPLPSTILIQYNDREHLCDTAEALGVTIVYDACRQLANHLKG